MWLFGNIKIDGFFACGFNRLGFLLFSAVIIQGQREKEILSSPVEGRLPYNVKITEDWEDCVIKLLLLSLLLLLLLLLLVVVVVVSL